jgi:DNA-directed RNA polymerase subunit L
MRVQTTGEVPAVEALQTACDDLVKVCDHMESTFKAAIEAYEADKSTADDAMETSQ